MDTASAAHGGNFIDRKFSEDHNCSLCVKHEQSVAFPALRTWHSLREAVVGVVDCCCEPLAEDEDHQGSRVCLQQDAAEEYSRGVRFIPGLLVVVPAA